MAMTKAPLPNDVLAALQRGQTLEAIRLLRQARGLGLKAAKDAIEAHARGTASQVPPAAVGGAMPAAVAAALHVGQKIEAIRLLREQTGLGLKEAKDRVDTASPQAPGLAPGEQPAGRGGWAGFIILVAGALGAWWLWRGH